MLRCQYCRKDLEIRNATVIACNCPESTNAEISAKSAKLHWLKERECKLKSIPKPSRYRSK